MSREQSQFEDWLRSHHQVGQFDRRDRWGQVSLTELDEVVLRKMRIRDLEEKANVRDVRYEELAFLFSVFSASPSAKENFLRMYPRYSQDEDEDIEFIVPQSPEDIQGLLDDARKMGLFQGTK